MSARILVTRPAGQAAELADRLRAHGVTPVEVPTVAIDSGAVRAEMDRMLARLEGADWLILTSANGAAALLERVRATGGGVPATTRVAAVGPATAATLRDGGVPVDHVPDVYLTVAIAEGLGAVAGRRIVLARADAATPHLRLALLERGALVEEVVAYRTIEGPPDSRDALRTALRDGLDGIAFTSGSTVRGLHALLGPAERPRATTIPAYCIGPVTARAAHALGFTVAATAPVHTAAGLVTAIVRHLEGDR